MVTFCSPFEINFFPISFSRYSGFSEKNPILNLSNIINSKLIIHDFFWIQTLHRNYRLLFIPTKTLQSYCLKKKIQFREYLILTERNCIFYSKIALKQTN